MGIGGALHMWKVLNVTCYKCYMLQNVSPHRYLTHFTIRGQNRD